MIIKDLVSVVITTYGRDRELLMQAINSVKSQTYNSIEIIVIDDNGLGTDIQKNNQQLFDKDKSVIYIANINNSGAQYSRNRGILESRGEYIAFLDDDDIWMSEKLENQVRLIIDKNAAMVFCNGYRFYNNDLNNKVLYQKLFIFDKPISYVVELQGDRIGSTSHPLIRKECLAKTGLFDLDMPARQDYEMWLRMCKYYDVWGLNEPLFYYRYHDGERITKSFEKELKSYKLLWKKYKDDYRKNSAARANIQLIIAITYFKNNDFLNTMLWTGKAMFSDLEYVLNFIKKRIGNRDMF